MRIELEAARSRSSSMREFLEIARERSDPPYDGEKCVLGWVERVEQPAEMSGSMARAYNEYMRRTREARELRKFYFEAPVGEPSHIHETDFGLFLVFVAEYREASGDDFESAKPRVMAQLKGAARDTALEKMHNERLVRVKYSGFSENELRALRNERGGRGREADNPRGGGDSEPRIQNRTWRVQ